jgi:DNA-binding response OmpR family regulator
MKNHKTVLIAEDELLIAGVLKLQFQNLGYEVENVADGSLVFKKALQLKPDIIILDINLKGNCDGVESGKKIRQAGINCPIVFTTGNSYQETQKQVHELKNTRILIKPVDFEQLLYIISLF